MMVVLRVAAHVGMPALREQGVDGAARAQEVDGAVGGREAEPRLEPASVLVQLGDGEAAGRGADRREHGASLRGRADARRKGELCGHGRECR